MFSKNVLENNSTKIVIFHQKFEIIKTIFSKQFLLKNAIFGQNRPFLVKNGDFLDSITFFVAENARF